MDAPETRHCSGCGQDKPLQQFQVNKENRDGTTWVKTRKWCHACCNALFERQKAAAIRSGEFMQRKVERIEEQRRRNVERTEERRRALGPLPPWCEAAVLDYLVNGEFSGPLAVEHGTRANPMLLLWQDFQKHERAIGEPLGGRGNRFIQSMAGLLKEDEAKFRQKLRRMCKRDENLAGVFETAAVAHMGRRRPKLRSV